MTNKMRPSVITNISGLPITQNPSVSLEFVDTDMGVVFNRLTIVQRDAIIIDNLTDGFFIYNTDIESFQFWSQNTQTWNTLVNGGTTNITFTGATESNALPQFADTTGLLIQTVPNTNVDPNGNLSVNGLTIGSATGGNQGTGTVNATGYYVNGDLFVGGDMSITLGNTNMTFSNTYPNLLFNANQYINFNSDDSNTDWRIAFGLQSGFDTAIVSNTNSLSISIGDSNTQGFAIGQAGGDSIFELNGYNKNVYFSGSVGIQNLNPSYPLDVNGITNTKQYYVNGKILIIPLTISFINGAITDEIILTAYNNFTVIAVNGWLTRANGIAYSIIPVLMSNYQSISQGAPITNTGFNANGTINTSQSLPLSESINVLPGNAIGISTTGTSGFATGSITIYLQQS